MLTPYGRVYLYGIETDYINPNDDALVALRKDNSEGSCYIKARPDLIFVENSTGKIYLLELKTGGYRPGYPGFIINANEFVFQYHFYHNRPYPVIVIYRSEDEKYWFVFNIEDGVKSMLEFKHIKDPKKNPEENIARFHKFFPGIKVDENANPNGGSGKDFILFRPDVKIAYDWLNKLKN